MAAARAPGPHASPLDRHDLYELCAQSPERDVRMLRAIWAGRCTDRAGRGSGGSGGRTLGEDFCGTGALSRAWTRQVERGRAVAVDHDPEPLARLEGAAGVRAIRADVMDVADRVDLIAVLNFSICEWLRRDHLVRYLAHARGRLKRGGVLIADIYGGADAFLTGRIEEQKRGPSGERITYTWEQRTADPFTGRVVNAMHFVVRPARGRGETAFDDAFVYDWRLWSVPELRDAMSEAGFRTTDVYPRTPDAIDAEGNAYATPVEDPGEVGDSYAVYVVGRV